MTAPEFTREIAGDLPPAVPAAQPPPADMPPLGLMVLDSLVDAAETIYTMLNCGEMASSGLALVGEGHLLDALRSLLPDRLVEVDDEHVVLGGRIVVRQLVGEPETSDDDLRRYWFRMTPAGEATWKAASGALDAYWGAHPLQPGDDGVASR
jgi:hypothetical protein